MPHTRTFADPGTVEAVLEFAQNELAQEIAKKGRAIFVSRHEVLGVLAEEMGELEDEVRKGDLDRVGEELRDVLVAALWGLVSIREGMDW
jgi:hypothetical protein